MHVLLPFDDEPTAGRGIRWWLRQADNRRADPFAPGRGLRDFDVPDQTTSAVLDCVAPQREGIAGGY